MESIERCIIDLDYSDIIRWLEFILIEPIEWDYIFSIDEKMCSRNDKRCKKTDRSKNHEENDRTHEKNMFEISGNLHIIRMISDTQGKGKNPLYFLTLFSYDLYIPERSPRRDHSDIPLSRKHLTCCEWMTLRRYTREDPRYFGGTSTHLLLRWHCGECEQARVSTRFKFSESSTRAILPSYKMYLLIRYQWECHV